MTFFDLPLEELRSYCPHIPEPGDFDAFWSQTLTDHPFTPSTLEWVPASDSTVSSFSVQDVRFGGYEDSPIAAWLLTPPGHGPFPTLVHFVGYGCGRGFPEEHLAWPASGFAILVVDARGQGGSYGSGGITADPAPAGGPTSMSLMTRGIHSPYTYYYRRVFVDAHHAVEAASLLPEVDESRIYTWGASQGGALSVVAAALNSRVRALMSDVPFLCHFRRAVGLSTTRPYEELTRFFSVRRDLVEQTFATLNYFDVVHFARRTSVPALFSTALMDEVCPPSTVFAMVNTYAGEHSIEIYPYNGHEGGSTYQLRRQIAWARERS